jgi:hypothetical protein
MTSLRALSGPGSIPSLSVWNVISQEQLRSQSCSSNRVGMVMVTVSIVGLLETGELWPCDYFGPLEDMKLYGWCVLDPIRRR